MDEFASPNLKLGRAYEHYAAFDEKLTAFQQANPYTTYCERDPHSRYQIPRVKVIGRPQPDPRWGTIVGDFASNLRGALDHLVWAMAVRPREPHKVEFPIDNTKRDLAGFQAKHLSRIGAIPDAAKEIVHGLQPYQRWGSIAEDPLWRIKKLANADKHRTVAVIVSAFVLPFSGNAALGYGPLLVPFPANAQVDPVIPHTVDGMGQAMSYSGTNLDARPTFAVVTTEGFAVPVDHLFSLYEFVRDKVFPEFPEHLFP